MEAFKEVIQQGITAFHVVEHGKKRLKQAGYQELEYGTDWSHLKAGDYYTVPYPSMLIAFHIGADEQQEGVRIAMAHTDSPCFKVKANPNMPGKYYVRANVEPYGGLLKTTWFDRPLGVAGKVILRGKDAFHPESRLVRSEAAVAVIPSLAPHLARGSEKSEINVQQELIPIIGLGETEDLLRDILWRPNGIEEAHILDYDLYLYNMDQPEETAEVIRDGWFYTGDLGKFDVNGNLWITGRKKNVIVMKNGKNIFPEEIEGHIDLLPYTQQKARPLRWDIFPPECA